MFDGLTNKQKIITIIIIVIAVIIIFVYIYNKNNNYNKLDESEILVSSEKEENLLEKDEKQSSKEIIVVHIAGEVNNPGIIKIEEGKRIGDAIELAGGITGNADITEINLAYVLEDGMKIKVPSVNEKNEGNLDYIIEDSEDDSKNDRSDKEKIVNINKATQTELETLQGIGPSLATRIIEYREENGKFKSIEDIKNVSGIGDSKYEAIKESISIK